MKTPSSGDRETPSLDLPEKRDEAEMTAEELAERNDISRWEDEGGAVAE